MVFSDDFLKAFGRVSVNFQTLEFSLALLTWGLISPQSHIGQIVTSQLSFRRLCDLVAVLFRYRIPDAASLAQLNDIVSQASGLEDRRNMLIHSVWMVADDGVSSRLKIKTERRRGLSVDFKETDASTLNELADSIEKLTTELQKLTIHLHETGIVARVHES